MAEADGYELDEVKWNHILKARENYEEEQAVPTIRKFAKLINEDQKELFRIWMTGPMKPITKYGGMPKPTAASEPQVWKPEPARTAAPRRCRSRSARVRGASGAVGLSPLSTGPNGGCAAAACRVRRSAA